MRKYLLILICCIIFISCWSSKNDIQRVDDLKNIESALQLYYYDEWIYPTDLSIIPDDYFRWKCIKNCWDTLLHPKFSEWKLPVDIIDWKVVDGCEFWYKYEMKETEKFIHWNYTLSSCIENKDNIPWLQSNVYEIKKSW